MLASRIAETSQMAAGDMYVRRHRSDRVDVGVLRQELSAVVTKSARKTLRSIHWGQEKIAV